MEKLNIEELREIQLNILKIVAEYCDKNNLTYFLGYGTLLGAVRHKGYIPWDDDIDILMPRLDYERFIKEFEFEDYDVKSHYKDSNYPYKFAKVSYEKSVLKENTDLKYSIGINIDIFPLDEFPDLGKDLEQTYRKIKFYDSILKIKSIAINPNRKFYKNMILRIGKILLRFIDYRKIIKKSNKESLKYSSNSGNEVMGNLFGVYGMKEIMNSVIFENKTELAFEGYYFYVPKKYKEYLTNIYGDYMQLPPENDRETHHDFKAFRL